MKKTQLLLLLSFLLIPVLTVAQTSLIGPNESQQLRRYDPQMQSIEQDFGQEKVTVSYDKSIPLLTRQALIRYMSQHYQSRVIYFEIDKLPGADPLYAVTGIFDTGQQAQDSAKAPTILLVLREQGGTVSEVSKVENDNGGAYGMIAPVFFLGQNKTLILVLLSSVDGDARVNLVYEYADNNLKPLGEIYVIEKLGMNGNLWRIDSPMGRATAEYKNNTYYLTVRGVKGSLYGDPVVDNGNPKKLASPGTSVTFSYDGVKWRPVAASRKRRR